MKLILTKIQNYILSICFLTTFLSYGNSEQFTCRVPGIPGKAPEKYCKFKHFLKIMEDFKENEEYLLTTHTYLFYGSHKTAQLLAAKSVAEGTDMIIKQYKAKDFVEDLSLVEKVYQEAEKELKRTKRPVIIVIENVEYFALPNYDHDYGLKKKFTRDFFHKQLDHYNKNPYIFTIFTSDVPSSQINGTILSRCGCGIIEWSQLPDYEDRKEIIEHFAKKNNKILPNWLVQLMAKLSYGVTSHEIEKALGNSQNLPENQEILRECYNILKHSYMAKGTEIAAILTALFLVKRFAIKGVPKPTRPTSESEKLDSNQTLNKLLEGKK